MQCKGTTINGLLCNKSASKNNYCAFHNATIGSMSVKTCIRKTNVTKRSTVTKREITMLSFEETTTLASRFAKKLNKCERTYTKRVIIEEETTEEEETTTDSDN